MAWLRALHHVQLAMPAGREAEAVAFYTGALGLEHVEKPESLAGRGGAWFRGPGIEVHLGVEEPFAPARKAHPAFEVTELTALCSRLAEAGAPLRRDVPLPGFDRRFTEDPFGNRIELLERLPSPQTAAHAVTTDAALRDIIGDANAIVASKVADRLNHMTRQFIERSPFCCIATADAGGACDVSPRGDPAGFVRILTERTLLIPERPGNRIADSLRNIIATGRVGLLFLIPGVGDTFRVNGRATIVDDPDLLAGSAVEGKVPRLGILVEIGEAYTQCAKALIRSDLWNAENHVDRAELPTQGDIMRSLVGEEIDVEDYNAARAARYARRDGFY